MILKKKEVSKLAESEKEELLKKIEAKNLIIDNLIKINVSMEEDRKSLLDEISKNYLLVPRKKIDNE